MKPRTIILNRNERIVAVVPDYCEGPGWRNAPVWVYIVSMNGSLREECIQPEERTPEMDILFHAGEAMCSALRRAVPVQSAR